MHHSKILSFTFKMVLLSLRCTVSFNSYSVLCIAYSIPLTCFVVIELFSILSLSSRAALLPPHITHCIFILFWLLIVKMATGWTNSIFRAQCTLIMTSMKFTTTSFRTHCRIIILESILFLSFLWAKTCQTLISANYLRYHKMFKS